MLVLRRVTNITPKEFIEAEKKVSTTKAVSPKEPTRDIPSDEYAPLLKVKEMELTESLKIMFQVRRGGEDGLPLVDIRLFANTPNYTGFTKKGFSMPANRLDEFVNTCWDVLEEIEEHKLLEEFVPEPEEDEDEI